ncbi:DUF4362 domain-containing protein [Halobacillus andaensis]|uniref:DUF4362 domain-containing protein n=1 Tax=Halobacillus andaensis TaxID=1176239 RepID=UPI003D7581A7
MKVRWLVWVVLVVAAGCSNQIAGIYDQSEDYVTHDHDVLDAHGKVKNTQYLDDFINNVNEQQEDEVRIVSYTDEGDPLFTYLSYDGDELTYKLDTSQDKQGSGETIEKSCETVERKELAQETVYQLGCGKQEEIIEILAISYDSTTQDQFELKFSYNKGNRVTVDTVAQSLSIQSESNSMKQENFRFTTEELNSIYKLLVKENYLQGKDLTGSCREEPEYSLKILINGSEKKFTWSSCDSGEDVGEMTDMAEGIIDLVEETKAYRKVFE